MTSRIHDQLRPSPLPDDLTRPFWESVQQRRLSIQRCQQCRTYFHPPLRQCDVCESRHLSFEVVSGRGRVYTFTRVHVSRHPAFVDAVPFAVVQVELDEQPGLLLTANMTTVESSAIEIGSPVEVTFLETGNEMLIPDFAPVEYGQAK